MKVLRAQAKNFASYKELDFTFDDNGLVLIQGQTGSGKSTLCDLIPWTAFGHTAKGGLANDVIAWPGDLTTEAVLSTDKIEIVRIRGKGKNDLYFYKHGEGLTQFRGKDLNDTQKLINNLLGLNIDLYLSAAYYHEFSQTAQFFTTTAKNRRTICEQVVDLSLAKSLQERVSLDLKETNRHLLQTIGKITQLESNIAFLTKMQSNELTKADTWAKAQALKLSTIEANVLKFEESRDLRVNRAKQMAKAINCSECGQVKPATHTHKDNSAEILDEVNPYLDQLEQAQAEANPHTGGVKDFTTDIKGNTERLADYKDNQSHLITSINDLETLADVLGDFRGVLVANTISDIESKTNSLLHTFFDGEIRVEFKIEDSDKLEVSILKDSNNCTYTQLSKGQRCMLKLCFGLAVMQGVQNHHGISIKQVFADEALDGLDDNNKLKAVKMLETIALDYDSIYLVEHSETIKAHIDNSYRVVLNNGNSIIEKV